MTINKKHLGSSFDDFLAEEGILAETESVAIKRVLAWCVENAMKEEDISKIEMALHSLLNFPSTLFHL